MKKQRKRQPRKKGNVPAPVVAPKVDRRALLRNWLIVGGGVVVGGFFVASTVMATIAEHDLTAVGQGVPMIVQVHDPQCTACQDLQRETRAALKDLGDDELLYRVANLTSDDGAAFANRYNAAQVTTLLLFDGSGALQGRLYGVRPREELRTVFEALIASGG